MRKVLLTFALALLLAVAATGVALAADTFEPNDTVSDAYRIYSGPKTSYIWSSTDVTTSECLFGEAANSRRRLRFP